MCIYAAVPMKLNPDNPLTYLLIKVALIERYKVKLIISDLLLSVLFDIHLGAIRGINSYLTDNSPGVNVSPHETLIVLVSGNILVRAVL